MLDGRRDVLAGDEVAVGLLVVGAALLDGGGRLLAACRLAPPELAGLWEFPGGKVEPGEGPRAALVRECREELGVDVVLEPGPTGVLGEVPIAVGRLRVYRGRVVAGEPVAVQHAALRWLTPGDLLEVPWIPADLPLVRMLAQV